MRTAPKTHPIPRGRHRLRRVAPPKAWQVDLVLLDQLRRWQAWGRAELQVRPGQEQAWPDSRMRGELSALLAEGDPATLDG